MIDGGALDARLVIAKLETAAADLGLANAEVAAILFGRTDAWPMPLVDQWAVMEKGQEGRLRDLLEICRMLAGVFGAEAVLWLRRPSGGSGITPLGFLKSDPGALRALRDVLRLEQGIKR
ncbi:hypothetical protein M9978_17515 [Sphingomonas sp. MG17]|uniref:Uncharacterized protein n=1 Tax=Sphingomonas tagetis TaxID=2949092 RepID=A0A9X2KMZ0_9SPHN|nr:hypothetical protein [Sphingomonas tagetis]MCP3732222.1 hypothetical protein [Sphingomonas tagetis]